MKRRRNVSTSKEEQAYFKSVADMVRIKREQATPSRPATPAKDQA